MTNDMMQRRICRPRLNASVGLLAAIGLAVSWPAQACGQVTYTILDLDGLGSNDGLITCQGINSSSQIVGRYLFNPPNGHAFRLNPGDTFASPGVDLGTLGGLNSFGNGINAAGQVVGRSEFVVGSSASRAYRTSPTGLVSDPGADLGVLPGASESSARGINASGQVTGFSDSNAFRTTPTGTLSDPGANIGPGIGIAINASGQVAGMNTATGRSFRTTPTGRTDAPGADLGTLGGMTDVWGMNDAGQVVGRAWFAGNSVVRAFRTSPTGLISDPGADLGTLPGFSSSEARAINSLGVVVGVVNTAPSLAGHAFIYDTQMRDLNDLIPAGSGWLLISAERINDSGQIIALATNVGGGPRHYLLLTPVPEPSSLAFGGFAVIGAWLVRRRRKCRRCSVV